MPSFPAACSLQSEGPTRIFQLEKSLSCLTNSQSSRLKRPLVPDHPLRCCTSKSSELRLLNTKPIRTLLSHPHTFKQLYKLARSPSLGGLRISRQKQRLSSQFLMLIHQTRPIVSSPNAESSSSWKRKKPRIDGMDMKLSTQNMLHQCGSFDIVIKNQSPVPP